MGQAVHEDQIAQGDQKVTRSPLPQLERPFIRGDAVDDFPGLGHGQNLGWDSDYNYRRLHVAGGARDFSPSSKQKETTGMIPVVQPKVTIAFLPVFRQSPLPLFALTRIASPLQRIVLSDRQSRLPLHDVVKKRQNRTKSD
jgi:hypothetical protein